MSSSADDLPATTVPRYADLRRAAFRRRPPAPLKGYAFAIGEKIVTVHGASSDKVAFEALRTQLRERLGFPVTQPGAFAVLVAHAMRDPAAFVELGARLASDGEAPGEGLWKERP